MSKRKGEDYEYLCKKLKKLERKIQRGRRRRHSETSDSPATDNLERNETNCDEVPGCSYWDSDNLYDVNSEHHSDDVTSISAANAEEASPLHTTRKVASQVVEHGTESQIPEPHITGTQASEPDNSNAPKELDSDVLEILGADPTDTKEFGKDIQKDLALRLGHIATKGLSKDIRKELKEKYLVPGNCKVIKAPSLNPEIRAALIESQIKRDKAIESKQMLTSCALSSISEAITIIIAAEQKNPEILKILMDSARILGDIQHSESITRRMFILSTLKKDLKDQLEKTDIDETLFGNNLSDTLKSAKNINKSGAELRSAPTPKPINQKQTNTATRSLNSKAPSNFRRLPQVGGARGTQVQNQTSKTTLRSTQHNNSRTSLRQQRQHHRR